MGQAISGSKNVYFISDAHLGMQNGSSAAEQRLLALFGEVKAYGSHLYIVGDLFDFWFEYRFAVPAAYLKTIAEILDLTRAGVKVFYTRGNHDFWMKDYIERQAGAKLTPDFFEASHFGKKILITHGDGLRRDDVGYRFIKRIFRNKACIWLFSQLPVNLAYRLAMGTSHASREYTSSRHKMDPTDYIEFARERVANGFDAVVMGHVHLPQIVNFERGQYINCGDFFEHFSYVALDEGGFRLCNQS